MVVAGFAALRRFGKLRAGDAQCERMGNLIPFTLRQVLCDWQSGSTSMLRQAQHERAGSHIPFI